MTTFTRAFLAKLQQDLEDQGWALVYERVASIVQSYCVYRTGAGRGETELEAHVVHKTFAIVQRKFRPYHGVGPDADPDEDLAVLLREYTRSVVWRVYARGLVRLQRRKKKEQQAGAEREAKPEPPPEGAKLLVKQWGAVTDPLFVVKVVSQLLQQLGPGPIDNPASPWPSFLAEFEERCLSHLVGDTSHARAGARQLCMAVRTYIRAVPAVAAAAEFGVARSGVDTARSRQRALLHDLPFEQIIKETLEALGLSA